MFGRLIFSPTIPGSTFAVRGKEMCITKDMTNFCKEFIGDKLDKTHVNPTDNATPRHKEINGEGLHVPHHLGEGSRATQ
jgi:hypothetical protein